MAYGRQRLKTEHAGAKNGGGAWTNRAGAKKVSKKVRRYRDQELIREDLGLAKKHGSGPGR